MTSTAHHPGTRIPRVSAPGRHETALERADRNLEELVQELRVAQTGVQMLFAFLLVVPFSARFGAVTTLRRDLYFAALLLAAAAAVLLITPASQHRLLFRPHDKRHLLFSAAASRSPAWPPSARRWRPRSRSSPTSSTAGSR